MRQHMLSRIILLATFAFSSTSSTCPSKCSCENNIVTCVGKELQDVPIFETIDINPVIVDLSGNKLISIDIYDFSFERNTGIKEVYLNSSAITDIEEKCFDELVSLQELYLNNNNLKSIPNKMIEKNQNMILLDLSNNILENFPSIISKSLEVFALANAGITSIPERGLSNLPSLRLLLLQENKLKYINPSVFDNLKSFFFVKLTYNLWNCDCDTVKLFDFLTAKGFADITVEEPIQCLTSERNFVNIYYNNGTSFYFYEKCNKNISMEVNQFIEGYKDTKEILGIDIEQNDEVEETKQKIFDAEDESKHVTDSKHLIKKTQMKSRENIPGTNIIRKLNITKQISNAFVNDTDITTFDSEDFYSPKDDIIITDACGSENFYNFMKIILLFIVPIAFLMGMLFGYYLMYAYGKLHMKTNITESSKRLLSPSVEQVVKEESA